jgi:UDP-N-acetylmuramate--alanine ligase
MKKQDSLYHLIGIGGIGMSALARLLVERHGRVQGSDLYKTPLTSALEELGVHVAEGHQPDHVGKATHVVYSSAVAKEHVEYQKALDQGCTIWHRARCLAELMSPYRGLFVTGTHGKTTTTAYLAHLLREAGWSPSMALGGICGQTRVNAHWGQGPFFVAEADESDGSFRNFNPFGLILTNLEPDHLDYWGSLEALEKGLSDWIHHSSIAPDHIVWCADDPCLRKFHLKGPSYGWSLHAQYRLERYRPHQGGALFDLVGDPWRMEDLWVPKPGRHVALNATAALLLGQVIGLNLESMRESLKTFQGVQRRLELRAQTPFWTWFDDYAHHPTEIQATLGALREQVKEARVIAIFQPHRYSRLRHLFLQFLESFEEADQIWITEVYAAGETPDPRLAMQFEEEMLRRWPRRAKRVTNLALHIEQFLEPHDILITLSAGNLPQSMAKALRVDSLSLVQPRRWKIALLSGGRSPERDISVVSKEGIRPHFDPALYDVDDYEITETGGWLNVDQKPMAASAIVEKLLTYDVVVPVMHGPFGEDGMVQGFLETLNIPYTGCSYASSAICMDKSWAKKVASFASVPIVPFVEMRAFQWISNLTKIQEEVAVRLGYPCWVKPVHLGSSLGVTEVEGEGDLREALALAFSMDDRVIIETHIEGRQIEYSLLGNDFIEVGAAVEILNDGAFYDYDKKYGEQGFSIQVPASLTPDQEALGRKLAIQVYEALGCQGLSRVDFFLDRQGAYWFNEINPIPGCTPISAYPKAFQSIGWTLPKLIDRLLIAARQRDRKYRERSGPCPRQVALIASVGV